MNNYFKAFGSMLDLSPRVGRYSVPEFVGWSVEEAFEEDRRNLREDYSRVLDRLEQKHVGPECGRAGANAASAE